MRAIEPREGVEPLAGLSLSSGTCSGRGLLPLAYIEFAVNFLSVLCESDVRSLEGLSSGVVGVEDANSGEAE